MSAKSEINQKEYLKKYLGIGKGSGEKKKKKKTKVTGKGLKIVDDNVDIRLNEEIKADLTADNDEAPIIVSVIDDRPPSLRIDEVTRVNLWQPIGAPSEPDKPEKGIKFEGNIKLSKNVGRKQVSVKRDILPVRKKTKHDNSPPRKRYGTDSDGSPPRRSRTDDKSPSIRKIKVEKDEDSSPPRKRKESPPKRTNTDSDSSPPRKKRHSKADSSPPRKIKLEKDEDNSPPRRRRESPPEIHNVDSDSSPPRRRRDNKKEDLPSKKVKEDKDEDISPPRRRRDSPPGRHNDTETSKKVKLDKDDDHSPPRRRKEGASPPRKRKGSPSTRKKSRWTDNEEQHEKMKTTLDGKTAGLQNAAELVKETERFKKREEELFKNLSAEVSGANAATIVRKKNKEVDWEEEEKKRKLEEETKEKYNRWGKGLKQVEDVNEKIKNDLHEMSKPLARYADDNDLETYLKEQEREGDPMLAYIRQKKKKKAVDEGKPVIQQFEGDAPPNRFGIRPGYRWDGVDRSSGYEKKWFEVQNSRQASLEENYKWSTEDM